MRRIENIFGKTVKFVDSDNFSVYCLARGNIYEDVNNYYYIPNFYGMDANGIYPKDEYKMVVVG